MIHPVSPRKNLIWTFGTILLTITENAPNPKKSFFRFEQAEFTLDFLPQLPGLTKFRPSYDKRVVSKIKEIEIPFIDYNDPIQNKEALGRPKDIEDIKHLKAQRKA